MITGVNRNLDSNTDSYLRRAAYTGGIDLRRRFLDKRYELAANLSASVVNGTADAIASTQRDGVHRYQRPDDDISFDPTRTSLSGDAERLTLSKFGGGITRFQSVLQRFSPGFETNDLGFQSRADEQMFRNWFSVSSTLPAGSTQGRPSTSTRCRVDDRRIAAHRRHQHQLARSAAELLVGAFRRELRRFHQRIQRSRSPWRTRHSEVASGRDLELQVYAQPFTSTGAYSKWRELKDPRAAIYADRFKPYTANGDPGGFSTTRCCSRFPTGSTRSAHNAGPGRCFRAGVRAHRQAEIIGGRGLRRR